MANNKRDRVCPVEQSGMLDMNIRRLLQNPYKILKPYLKEGMKVLDMGCGPGFFTMEAARLAGKSGKVIGADLQQGMLDKLKAKIQNTPYSDIIKLHKCRKDAIGLSEKVDLILVIFMLHEVPDQSSFIKEIKTLLNSGGKVLIIEPKFHVSKKAFIKAINMIREAGFDIIEESKLFLSRTVVAKRM